MQSWISLLSAFKMLIRTETVESVVIPMAVGFPLKVDDVSLDKHMKETTWQIAVTGMK